jgi:hypothetical protein
VLIASTAPFVVRRWLALLRRAADASAASWTVVVYDEWYNTVAAISPSAVTVAPAWRRRGVAALMNVGALDASLVVRAEGACACDGSWRRSVKCLMRCPSTSTE